MSKINSSAASAPITVLKDQVRQLKTDLAALQTAAGADEQVRINVKKIEERFRKQRNLKGPDQGFGNYLLLIDITARKETVYVPISVGSGRVSTGFVYQVEGTAKAAAAATISLKSEGVLKVTAGSILYAKIPSGQTATFKIVAEIEGKLGRAYRIMVTRVNYKLNPNDSRYKRLLIELPTKLVEFD